MATGGDYIAEKPGGEIMRIDVLKEEKSLPFFEQTPVSVVCGDGTMCSGEVVGGKYLRWNGTAKPVRVIPEGAERQGKFSDALNSIHGPKQLGKWVISFLKQDSVNEKGLRSILPAMKALLRFDPSDAVISRPERLLFYALNYLNEREPRNTEPLADAAIILKSCESDPAAKRKALQKCFNHVKRQCVDLCFALHRDEPKNEGLIRVTGDNGLKHLKVTGLADSDLDFPALKGLDPNDPISVYKWLMAGDELPFWDDLAGSRLFTVLSDGNPLSLGFKATAADPALSAVAEAYNKVLALEAEIASAGDSPSAELVKKLEQARLDLIVARQSLVIPQPGIKYLKPE